MKRLLSIALAALILVNSAFTTMAKTVETPSSSGYQVELQDTTVKSPLLNVSAGSDADDKDAVKHAANDVVRVSIILEKPSTVEKGYSLENVAANKNAVSYRNSLVKEQASITTKIEKVLGHELEVKWNLTLAANIISANVKYSEIEAIEAVNGVEAVVLENQFTPDTDEPNTSVTTSGMVFATNVWANGYTGAGSVVAVVDTGTDQDHISFQADALEYALTKDGKTLADYDLLTVEKIAAVLSQLNASSSMPGVTAEQLHKNTKIAYAFNYVDRNLTTDHLSDTQGEHGSHVSGISAANRYVKVDGEFVEAATSVYAVGVAPDAQLMTMKVFGSRGGAYDSDYFAAIEDAIVLGADSINLSLGSGSAGFSFSPSYQAILNSIPGNSSMLTISAGNASSWYDTANNPNQYGGGILYKGDVAYHTGGSPGSFVNTLCIASADNIGVVGMPLLFGDKAVFYTETSGYKNAPITTIAGELEYVYVDGTGTTEEYAAANEVVSLEGKVVLCNRGAISFYQKADNAAPFGAAAVIVVNNQAGTISMDLSSQESTIPCVSITQADGQAIKAASTEAGTNLYTGKVTVTDSLSSAIITDLKDATISSFSSWGGQGSLNLKPELATPGGSIYSVAGANSDGSTVNFADHASFELMSGTSMAAPHANGMSGLLAQYIRENDLAKWTDGNQRTLINSLLMSTSVPMKNDGEYISILQQGSGLANVYAATKALSFIMMDANATVSYADGKVKAELGDDPTRTGVYVYNFNVTNMSNAVLTYKLSTELFTQEVYEDLVLPTTVELPSTTTYKFDVVPHDVDKDGDTDTDDVQAILDYITGVVDGSELDLAAGEMDGVEGLSSYDAKLLLEAIKNVTEYLVVEPGKTANVEVTITLDSESLSEQYEKGTFIEGYTYVECVNSTEEGEELDVTHSIPVYGYFGSWTDPSMFDCSSPIDQLYSEEPHDSYLNNPNTNYLSLQYPGSSAATAFVGNPYIVEDKFPADRLAISSETVVKSAVYSLIRNAGTVVPAVLKADAEGNPTEVLYSGALQSNVGAAYYYTNQGTWQNTAPKTANFNLSMSSLDVAEGDKVVVGLYAIPEYNAMKLNGATSGNLTKDQFATVATSGELGDGAKVGYTFTVDNTAPEMISAQLSDDKSTLTVVAKDNSYIAYVGLMDVSGLISYVGVCPEQSAPGEEVTVTIDASKYDLGNACSIVVGDYAANETAKLAILGDGPITVKHPIYKLADTLVDGGEYIIADINTAGQANVLNSNGYGYYNGNKTVTVVTDEKGTYIPVASAEDSFLWTASAASGGFTFSNNAYGPYLCEMGNGLRTANYSYSDTWTYSNGHFMYGGNEYLQWVSTSNQWQTRTAEGTAYIYGLSYYEEEINPSQASKVEVNPEEAIIFGAGKTTTLVATVYPSFLENKAVTWTSSDETVATVDENGVVTSVAEGTATITATSVVTPTVSGSATVTVAVNNPINAVVNAQVSDAKGDNFVAIDLNTFERTVLADAGVAIRGGGRDMNTIYAIDADGDFDTYDVSDDYAGSSWFAMNEVYGPLDGSRLYPLVSTIDGVKYGLSFDEKMFGLATTDYGYICCYDTDGNLSGWNWASLGKFVAIAFAGAGVDEDGVMSSYYYMVKSDGHLYLAQMAGEVEDGVMDEKLYYRDLGVIDGLTVGEDVWAYSMTYVGEQTKAEQLILADNAKKLLYVVTIDADDEGNVNSITAKLVCALEGVENIACLYNDDFDAWATKAPVIANKASLTCSGSSEVLVSVETEAAPSAGSLNAIANYTATTRRVNTTSAPVVLAKATLTPSEVDGVSFVEYTEDVAVTNGLVTVEYDAEKVTFLGVDTDVDFYSVNDVDGVVTFAYVCDDAAEAGSTIASFRFTVGCEDADLTVTVKELNDDVAVADANEVTLEGTGHDWQFVEIEWNDDYTKAVAHFVCGNNEEHTLDVDCTVTSEMLEEPTEGKDGKKRVTATVELGREVYTDTVELDVPYVAPTGDAVPFYTAVAVMSVSFIALAAAIILKKKVTD